MKTQNLSPNNPLLTKINQMIDKPLSYDVNILKGMTENLKNVNIHNKDDSLLSKLIELYLSFENKDNKKKEIFKEQILKPFFQKYHSDPNIVPNGTLGFAVFEEDLSLIKLLLENKSDPKKQKFNLRDLFRIWTFANSLKMIEIFIQHYPRLGKEILELAIERAIDSDNKSLIIELIKNYNLTNLISDIFDGLVSSVPNKLPITDAHHKKLEEWIEFFTKPQPDLKYEEALKLLVEKLAAHLKSTESLKLLVEKLVNSNLDDIIVYSIIDNLSILQQGILDKTYIIESESKPLTAALLKNSKDPFYDTPLMKAILKDNYSEIRHLPPESFNVHNQEGSILYHAFKVAINNNNIVVQHLLLKGANPNIGNHLPLILAIDNCRQDLVEILLDIEVDINQIEPATRKTAISTLENLISTTQDSLEHNKFLDIAATIITKHPLLLNSFKGDIINQVVKRQIFDQIHTELSEMFLKSCFFTRNSNHNLLYDAMIDGLVNNTKYDTPNIIIKLITSNSSYFVKPPATIEGEPFVHILIKSSVREDYILYILKSLNKNLSSVINITNSEGKTLLDYATMYNKETVVQFLTSLTSPKLEPSEKNNSTTIAPIEANPDQASNPLPSPKLKQKDKENDLPIIDFMPNNIKPSVSSPAIEQNFALNNPKINPSTSTPIINKISLFQNIINLIKNVLVNTWFFFTKTNNTNSSHSTNTSNTGTMKEIETSQYLKQDSVPSKTDSARNEKPTKNTVNFKN